MWDAIVDIECDVIISSLDISLVPREENIVKASICHMFVKRKKAHLYILKKRNEKDTTTKTKPDIETIYLKDTRPTFNGI